MLMRRSSTALAAYSPASDRTLLWHSIVVVVKTRIRRRPIPNPVILSRPRRPHKWCNRHIDEHERRRQRKLLIRDEPVVVHCYTTPDDIEARSNLAELGRFCRKMGRDAHQGEIGLVIGNEYFAIHDFEE